MTHSSRSTRLSCLAFLGALLTLASCSPLRNYGRSVAIAQECIAADELRGQRGRGEHEPINAPGSPVPVTPADNIAQPNGTAAAITCDGGLTR